MAIKRTAVVRTADKTVVNIIITDPDQPYDPGPGLELIDVADDNTDAGIGATHQGNAKFRQAIDPGTMRERVPLLDKVRGGNATAAERNRLLDLLTGTATDEKQVPQPPPPKAQGSA